MGGMSTKEYKVTGMTCGHCEMSVQEEISEISGVTSVKADHTTGTVTVEGDFDESQIAPAIDEAGFKLG